MVQLVFQKQMGQDINVSVKWDIKESTAKVIFASFEENAYIEEKPPLVGFNVLRCFSLNAFISEP